MTDVSEQKTDKELDLLENNEPIDKQKDDVNKTNNPSTLTDETKSNPNNYPEPQVPLQEVQNKFHDTFGNTPMNTIVQNTTLPSVNPNANQQMNIEQQLQKAKKDLESMVLRYANSERDNLQNKKKVEELDKKLKRTIKDNEQLANRIKLLTNDKNQLTDTLNAKVAQLTVLEQKNSYLTNVQGVKLTECEEKLKKLEVTNEDLMNQIENYKSKEGELLDFSERLSMKHMLLQTELDEALKKVPNYKDLYETALKEKEDLSKTIEDLETQMRNLEVNLENEKEQTKSLVKEIEKNEIKHKYSIDELQNEIKVMRRKHQIANRELVKEIKQLQAQLERVSPPTLLISSQNIQ